MRIVSFEDEGQAAFGVAVGGQVISGARLSTPYRSLRELLASESGLTDLADAAATAEPDLELAALSLLPAVPEPQKIVCVGVNYRAHLDETGRDPAAHPTIFTRFADSQVGADRDVVCPDRVKQFDYEGELAVVIGRGGQAIPAERAYRHIAGYACYNDFSARDWQRHSGQWTAGKNFPGTGAMGPWLVTADEAGDVTGLRLETRVNGDVRQSASTGDMVFGIPELIAYISAFTPLGPGDVIVTGTPGGVGLFRQPPEFLQDGDVVEVEIDGIGLLRNVVRR